MEEEASRSTRGASGISAPHPRTCSWYSNHIWTKANCAESVYITQPGVALDNAIFLGRQQCYYLTMSAQPKSYLKQIACLRRKSNLTRKEFFDHHFQVHGSLADVPSNPDEKPL